MPGISGGYDDMLQNIHFFDNLHNMLLHKDDNNKPLPKRFYKIKNTCDMCLKFRKTYWFPELVSPNNRVSLCKACIPHLKTYVAWWKKRFLEDDGQ